MSVGRASAATGASRAGHARPDLLTSLLARGGSFGRPSMLWMAGGAILVTFAALLPLAFVVWVGIQTGWETASALIFRPRVGELLVNTGLLVIFTVPLCTLLGVALAWLTERADLPGARLGPGSPSRRWRCRRSCTDMPGSASFPACMACSRASSSRCWPISLFSTCRSPRRCGGSIPPWRIAPPRSASRRRGCSCGWCCRSCGSPSAAARC